MIKLPKTQAELLGALLRRVPVYYMQGWHGSQSYFLRMDTQKKVTASAYALIDKGLAKTVRDGPGIVLQATGQDRAHA